MQRFPLTLSDLAVGGLLAFVLGFFVVPDPTGAGPLLFTVAATIPLAAAVNLWFRYSNDASDDETGAESESESQWARRM